MTDKITLVQFEGLLADFGRDINLWPDVNQIAGRAFAATEEGCLLLAADSALDDMFAVSRAIGPETASDSNSDAFLDRLMDIPVYHRQAEQTKKVGGPTSWIKAVFAETSDWLSPAALASQAAAFAAVLAVGVLVGLNSAQATYEYDEIDISETWFVSSSDFELDEQ